MIDDVERIEAAIANTKRLIEERRAAMWPGGWEWPEYWIFLFMSTFSRTAAPPWSSLGDQWTYDDDKGKLLIKMAKNGDTDADKALCELAARCEHRSSPLPPNLRTYVFARWRSCATPNRTGPKTKPYINFPRNYAIVCAVKELVRRGFYFSRNDATKEALKRESACSIVATALASLDIKLGETAVAKVYNKHATLVMHFEPIRFSLSLRARGLEPIVFHLNWNSNRGSLGNQIRVNATATIDVPPCSNMGRLAP
jgi:hypothetical protein